MKSIETNAGPAVTRLGAIGNHQWWHCRTCGDVWSTSLGEDSAARPQAVAEARRHVATHAGSQHSRTASWQRMPSVRAMSEKPR